MFHYRAGMSLVRQDWDREVSVRWLWQSPLTGQTVPCETRLKQKGQRGILLTRSTLRLDCFLRNNTETKGSVWGDFDKVHSRARLSLVKRLKQMGQCGIPLTRFALRPKCPLSHKSRTERSMWNAFDKVRFQPKMSFVIQDQNREVNVGCFWQGSLSDQNIPCDTSLEQRCRCEIPLTRFALRPKCPLWDKSRTERLLWDTIDKVRSQTKISPVIQV